MTANDDITRQGTVAMTCDTVAPTTLHELVAGIPSHRSFFAWRGKGGTFAVGIGHAWRLMSEPSEARLGLSSLWALLRTATHEVFQEPLLAFAWTFFDPEDRRADTDPVWTAFSKTEMSVPEVLFVGKPGEATQRVLVCDETRLEHVAASADAILKNARATTGRPRSVHLNWHSDAYTERVKLALQHIESGSVEKVVLARCVDGIADDDFDIAATLGALEASHPECFVFAIRPGGSAQGPAPVFLGATPERLLRVSDGCLATEGLAGSVPRGVSAAMDERLANELLASEKDRHEHEVVCLRIEEALAPHVASLQREVGAPKIKRLKNVQHLHTEIQAQLNGESSIVDVVDSLHPTPAVGGKPTNNAKELIRELEPFRRGLYAGTAGWVDANGNGEFGVLIRSALIRGNQISLFAGAGIVAGSEPERETEETRIKLDAILECLR
jgi:isochorismate synthase